MIEDIDFLYKNSRKENIIIIVDSAKRNRDLYPSVGEFGISFPQPFNNVYGIDILNTTIPRTQFMIEINNNTLNYRYGYNILSDMVEHQFTFMPQDFSSASAFLQRMNDQMNPRFNIDNYENTVFDDSFSQRTVTDYPIPRISSSMSPFLFNMSKSSAHAVFGFDCSASKPDLNKFNSFNNVLDFFCPIRKYPLTYTEPYETIRCKYNQSDPHIHFFNSFKFNYKHNSKFKCGSFLQKLTITSNLNFSSSNNLSSNIVCVIYDETSKIFLVDKLNVTYESDVSNSIIVTKFVNDTNELRFGGTNNHFVLKHNHQYSIIIDNVYVNNPNFNLLNVDIGFCYFYQLENIDTNDNIFMSKSICNPESFFNVTHTTVNTNTTTLCKNIFPINFNLHFSTDLIDNYFNVTSLGLLTQFRIEVKNDDLLNDMSEEDFFVLRITKKPVDLGEGIIYGQEEELCEICLHLFTDTNTNKSYLQFSIVDNIQESFFGQVHLSIGVDSSTIFPFECTLFTSKPINIIGSDSSFNYDYIYQIVDGFGIGSPGMMNLATDNYVILRCPEIENHLRGSFSVNEQNDPGMGVLNIDVQGYASGRTEFFSVIYKEFHPIGKLDKMTFRFERKSDKQLYDFKNVNLHFLMSIKFLRPYQKNTLNKSILNPNYDPNYLGYFNNNMREGFYENSSDEEDEEYIIDEHMINNLDLNRVDDSLERQLAHRNGREFSR